MVRGDGLGGVSFNSGSIDPYIGGRLTIGTKHLGGFVQGDMDLTGVNKGSPKASVGLAFTTSI